MTLTGLPPSHVRLFLAIERMAELLLARARTADTVEADEGRMRASHPKTIAALAEIIKEVVARKDTLKPEEVAAGEDIPAPEKVACGSHVLTPLMIENRDEAITYVLPAMLLARQLSSLYASGGSACDVEMFDAQELSALHAALVKHLQTTGPDASEAVAALSAEVCRGIEHGTEEASSDVRDLTQEVNRIVYEMPSKRIYITLKLAYEKAGIP